jgi:isoleucyl-tRNA synthetase
MSVYRETLNLPKTAFPMKANLKEREPERLRWWEERDLYAKLRRLRAGAPVWLLHDGPPYSNAHLHMGTAANKIWKDAAVRQASLMGFDSPYLPGWDNHGMPIEIHVSREFREKGAQPDRLALRKGCRAYAEHWVGIQRDEFKRLGVWGEWNHPYLTMDHAFEAAILDAFAALAARGFIQRGLRSIHWCPTDRTALAEAEIEYSDVPSPSILVAFPLRSDATGALARWPGVSAVAWTTTPWTLPANVGLMVDPDADYAVVETGGARYVVAAARREAVATMARWSSPQVVETFKGKRLLGSVFEGPWGRDSRVVDGTPFVSLDDGTGIVHMAPGHGKEDFQIGKQNGLEILSPVDEAGRFGPQAAPFEGRSVLEVNEDIVRWLQERGRLLASGSLVHAYPHCWRCRRPVIFRATDQWFMIIDHDGHRDRALELIDRQVSWDPATSQNRIRESVRSRPDWCLSRQRSWGVGIPAVYCDACGEAHLVDSVMKRAAELVREQGSDTWFDLPVERFLPTGFVCPACGKPGPFRKETDILDVWFDSGSTYRAARATHPAFASAWEKGHREDGRVVYFEGPDQHRGWFNSSLMVGVGIDREAPYTHVLTHGWVLDAEGRAMHKSLGNVISPLAVVERHGAEIVRWWALATDWRGDVRVGDEILDRVADAYRKVRNTFRFVLGNLADFEAADAVPDRSLTRVDRAFADCLVHRVERIRRSYEALQFHRALDQLLNLCTVDLSAVFLDVAKDRLYTLDPRDPARRSAQTVLWRALRELCVAASPALVFTSDEVWQHHPSLLAEAESVHLASWTRPAETGASDEEWAFLVGIRDAVNAAIEPLRAARELATTLEAEITLTVPPTVASRLAPYMAELPGFLLVAAVAVSGGAEGQAVEVAVRRTALARCDRCWTYRPDVTQGLCSRCTSVLAAAGRSREGRPA